MTWTRTAAAAAALAASFCFAPPLRAEEPPTKPADKKDDSIPNNRKVQIDGKGGTKVEVKELIKELGGDKEQKPKSELPKKVSATIAPDAKTVLDAVTAAYQKLSAVEVAGTLTADMSIGGQVVDERASFVSSFAAPNKFRHEMKGDVVVGSTGESLYAHLIDANKYRKLEAAKDRARWDQLPDPVREVLREQNPALLAAIVDDAGKVLADMAKDVTKAPDVVVNGQPLTALDFKGGWTMDFRVLVDPKTNLIRQVVQDHKRPLAKKGRTDVERATVTIDYPTVAPGAKIDANLYAWVAPEGAKDIATEPAAREIEASALLGKPAPDFKLPTLDGKSVALADLKGQVVVLDFWATWCGPCKQSLPDFNKLQKELGDKGVTVLAIDVGEPKDKVQPVAAKLIPDVTVLLDENEEVGPSYLVEGIPQTVVIGRDGTVIKVTVGAGHATAIRAAVDKALAE